LLEVQVGGLEPLRSLLAQGAGVLIAPNHPGHADSYALYEAAHLLGRPFYVMTAWQVFAMASRWERWIYQRLGCFSVDREGTDLRAFKRAVQILAAEPYPLVVFPEGEVYHINDRVTPFREGPAVMALTAVKHADRPVYAVPCAIKYEYLQDPTPQLEEVMAQIEQRIFWRPQPHRKLAERIYRFAQAALALKEIEYLGTTQQGALAQRIQQLREQVLHGLEQEYGLAAREPLLPERLKNVRRAYLERLEEARGDRKREAEIQAQLEDVFFVVQLFSYPGDYVVERPTPERLAETIDKFEEDVLGRPTAGIRGARRAVVAFGEPIDVRRFAAGAGPPRKAARPLTNALEGAVQDLLDGINRRENPERRSPAQPIGVESPGQAPL
jgi:1-acyl-sn-glycerol-3-phosphate acyltransferase